MTIENLLDINHNIRLESYDDLDIEYSGYNDYLIANVPDRSIVEVAAGISRC